MSENNSYESTVNQINGLGTRLNKVNDQTIRNDAEIKNLNKDQDTQWIHIDEMRKVLTKIQIKIAYTVGIINFIGLLFSKVINKMWP